MRVMTVFLFVLTQKRVMALFNDNMLGLMRVMCGTRVTLLSFGTREYLINYWPERDVAVFQQVEYFQGMVENVVLGQGSLLVNSFYKEWKRTSGWNFCPFVLRKCTVQVLMACSMFIYQDENEAKNKNQSFRLFLYVLKQTCDERYSQRLL